MVLQPSKSDFCHYHKKAVGFVLTDSIGLRISLGLPLSEQVIPCKTAAD